MTKSEAQALKELADAATPGPMSSRDGEVRHRTDDGWFRVASFGAFERNGREDAEFFVASHTGLPSALDMLERCAEFASSFLDGIHDHPLNQDSTSWFCAWCGRQAMRRTLEGPPPEFAHLPFKLQWALNIQHKDNCAVKHACDIIREWEG